MELRDKIKEKILDNVTGVYHLEFNAGNELEEMLDDIMTVINKLPIPVVVKSFYCDDNLNDLDKCKKQCVVCKSVEKNIPKQ